MLRRLIFWAHLSCGVTAGLVVLMMSVTGAALTYKRQILAFADRGYYVEPAEGQSRLSIDALLTTATERGLQFSPTKITLWSDSAAPAMLRAGRTDSAYVSPYTGEIYQTQNQALIRFFTTITHLHRWFNVSGDGRDTARTITGISNLMFLFLIISGLYLWLPRLWRWSAFRLRVWFSTTPNSAARDFNWHHVLGIWTALPLLVITATATVFNYSWANDLVYRLAGDEPPRRAIQASQEASAPETNAANVERLPLEALYNTAAVQVENWNTLTLNLPTSPTSREISFTIDQGNGGQPQKRHNLTLDISTGERLAWEPFSSLPAGRQARSWVRYLHTGEALGIVGQTVAGLACLAAAVMVWTGLALVLRRLHRFTTRRKKPRNTNAGSITQSLIP
jgi:uncharacterized iron-regulated membrane protein